MSLNRLQQEALDLIGRGLIIQAAHRPDHASGGKQPIASGWQNAERMDEAGALALWAGEDPPNLSVLTGERGGVFVIDIDGRKGAEAFSEVLNGRRMPKTLTVKTPNGGWHFYFRHPLGVHVPTNKSRLAPNVDLRGDGGQVIGPGSQARKKDGSLGVYKIIEHAKIAEAPDWLLDLCTSTALVRQVVRSVESDVAFTSMSPQLQQAARAYVDRAVQGITDELRATADWDEGVADDWGRGWEKTQADAAYRLAGLALAGWTPLSLEDAHEAFVAAAPTDVGWTDRDVETKWASQVTRANPAPMPPNLGNRGSIFDEDPSDAPVTPGREWRMHTWDDIGNGERLVAFAGERLRWVANREKWARYEHGTWHLSKDAGEHEAQKMIVRLKDLEAGLYADSKTREAFEKWVKTQANMARVQAAARSARYSGHLNVETSDFDKHTMLLNVSNGVIDLATGQLLPHSPDYMFREQSAATYDPDAKAPRWEAFLDRMMPDPEMRSYLQRAVGYTLTARTDEQAFFIHHGVTKNGKSLFLSVLEAMLGSYAQTVPSNTFLTKKYEQHPADVARMEGRRLLMLSETPQGSRLDEALVKRLSGSDTVTARGMGEEFREIEIIGKVHLVTNHLPHINHDPATMRRVHMIHWSQTISDEERDPLLGEKIITQELAGVLAWAVRGCLEWQRQHLSPPLVAQMDASTYFEEEDQLGQWIAERVIQSNVVTPSHMMYQNYKLWCEVMGIPPMQGQSFFREFKKRDLFEHVRGRNGSGYRAALLSTEGTQIHW